VCEPDLLEIFILFFVADIRLVASKSANEAALSTSPDFRQTWLWDQAFVNPRSDSTIEEQEFFRASFLAMRERAALLVSRIAVDMPGMTVHDITHLDALWDTASIAAEGSVGLNPPEALVLGGAFLLHDAGMSLAAYPGGLSEIVKTIVWKDAIARYSQLARERGEDEIDVEDPPQSVSDLILPQVLRRLHALQAEALPQLGWATENGEELYLIEDSELRYFYGRAIGQIAHSHWWPIERVERDLGESLGAFPNRTRSKVDRVKLACLLRIADALHLDQLRAPRFLRALSKPIGVSANHWSFQERLARPHAELDSVVFTAAKPFEPEEAEAWWLAYDALAMCDRELRDVDLLLRNRGTEALKVRRVKGVGAPEALARTIETRGWRPVDARIQASDVPRIVENLGGAKLYGDDPTVALRELIQNGADAVQARRKLQGREESWGEIVVRVEKRGEDHWLSVEDNGIGMSELVLTGALIDFGTSFWRSQLAMEEFPGLIAAGMKAIGKFGIGFFSVFMLGANVRVTSRRFDRAIESARCLEFRGGTSTRPILMSAPADAAPIDGGTRVEVQLRNLPDAENGLLRIGRYYEKAFSLATVVASTAPNLDVDVIAEEYGKRRKVVQAGDWLKIADLALIRRVNPTSDKPNEREENRTLMRPIVEQNGEVRGRAFIKPDRFTFGERSGLVTVAGLRATKIANIEGLILGDAVTASRDAAVPLVSRHALSNWATEQARLIAEKVKDFERQARSAEIVLECDGDVGNLKLLNLGGNWLSVGQFRRKLRSKIELIVTFDGDFSYEEDTDDVLPRDFDRSFELDSNVIVVFEHDGSMIRSRISWPHEIIRQPKVSRSRTADLFRATVESVWGTNVDESEERCVVGKVHYEHIERDVKVFRRQKRSAG
jgi:hypothetical protein